MSPFSRVATLVIAGLTAILSTFTVRARVWRGRNTRPHSRCWLTRHVRAGAVTLAAAALCMAPALPQTGHAATWNGTHSVLAPAPPSIAPSVDAARTHMTVSRLAGVAIGPAQLAGAALASTGPTTVTHGLGARYDPHLHVIPAGAQPGAAPLVTLPASVDLSSYFPPVGNQGHTNSCGAWAITEALYAARRLQGEAVPWSFSPYYTYWYALGGYNSNAYTTMEQEVAAVEYNGVVNYQWQTGPGRPSAQEIKSSMARIAYYSILFYNAPNPVPLLKEALANHQIVVLLITVNAGFMFAQHGQQETNNEGATIGTHFVVATGYNADGSVTIQNSWGTYWGVGGHIRLSPSALARTINAAYVISPYTPRFFPPSPIIWPPVTFLPYVLPQYIPPQRRRAGAAAAPIYVVTQAQYLRPQPSALPPGQILVPRGAVVYPAGNPTPHWRPVRYGRDSGYVLTDNIAPPLTIRASFTATPMRLPLPFFDSSSVQSRLLYTSKATLGTTIAFDRWTYGAAVRDAATGQLDRRWYHRSPPGYGWTPSAYVNGNAPNSPS